MKAKAVIFDFNGTLFMDGKYHDIAWAKTVEEITGVTIENTPKEKMFGHMNKDVIQNLRPDYSDRDNENVSKRKEQMYRELVCKEDQQLDYNVIELFDYLKENNIKFTIASASIKDNIDFFVERFKLDQWIDPSTILYDDGRFDTKIPMYKEAFKVLGVNPEDCVIFEDSKSGISCGVQSGVNKVIGIGNLSIHSLLKEYGAHECIDGYKIEEFSNYLELL